MAGATFKFTSEAPSQQLYTDVGQINALNDEQLVQFVGVTMKFLAQDATAADLLTKFSATYGVNPKALKSTVKGILYFFGEALKRNLSPAQVREDLVNLGLGEAKATLLSNAWEKNFVELSQSMIAKTLKFNELIDLEWKFGVTASTSDLSQAGTCFLQLKLVLDRGDKKENVLMELSLPQFYQFLAQMQAASRQCDLSR